MFIYLLYVSMNTIMIICRCFYLGLLFFGLLFFIGSLHRPHRPDGDVGVEVVGGGAPDRSLYLICLLSVLLTAVPGLRDDAMPSTPDTCLCLDISPMSTLLLNPPSPPPPPPPPLL